MYPVYTAVVSSSELNEKLIGVYPYFDEISMTFTLRAVNQYRIMLSQCQNALEQCAKKMTLAEPNSEYYEQLVAARTKVLDGINLCTEEVICKRDAELVYINDNYSLMPRLHLIVIKNCLDFLKFSNIYVNNHATTISEPSGNVKIELIVLSKTEAPKLQ